MGTRIEWLRTNYTALAFTLTNWVYRTSDHVELIYRNNNNPKTSSLWPFFLYDPNDLNSISALRIVYNLWNNRRAMNVGHAGTWSGDGEYSFDSPYDTIHYYKISLNGNKFTLFEGDSVDDITNIAVTEKTIGTVSDTDTISLALFGQNPMDCEFYSLTVWRDNAKIHEYVPILGGIMDIVDHTEIPANVTGYVEGPRIGYDVIYNSNGGEGSMSNQNIPRDTPTPLTLNTFTKPGKMFAGWSTTPSGSVVYQDGEIVENLAEAGESITLYAVWISSGYLDLIIQQNTSDSIKMDKNLTTLLTLRGTLKTPVSIIDPVILIQADLFDLVNANYMTIPVFERKYFIRNITSVKNGLVEISAHVDVLETYKTQIRANRGIISRAESRNVFNLLLNDGSLKSYQDPYILTEPFPAGFTGQAFVLAVAGG